MACPRTRHIRVRIAGFMGKAHAKQCFGKSDLHGARDRYKGQNLDDGCIESL